MMTADRIPDLLSLLGSLCDICLAIAFVGCLFTLLEAALVLGFPLDRREQTAAQPPVTILKPLHCAEPGLRIRLAALCRQHYEAPIQIICGAQDLGSSAIDVVREMKAEFPDKAIELNIDPRSHGANRKISNLINMLPRTQNSTIVFSDSDILVGPGYLQGVTAPLAAPHVGAVTCLYYGLSGEGLWARLSALAINSHFLPQAIAAIGLKLGKPCCGATIAMRRSTLDRIGGFGAFADALADDYAIGVAVRSTGYEVVTAPFVVGHRCFEGSLRQLVRHQMRVARTIRSIDPIGYAGTIVTHPWPLALIGMLSGSADGALVAIAALIARVMLCRCVERRFALPHQSYWLIPLQDIVAFAIYVTSFGRATVHWRGVDYRVADDGRLIEHKT